MGRGRRAGKQDMGAGGCRAHGGRRHRGRQGRRACGLLGQRAPACTEVGMVPCTHTYVHAIILQ